MMRIILMMALLTSVAGYTNSRHYAVSVEQSQWILAKDSRLQCAIEHNIPGYGLAVFSSDAGKIQNLRFHLDMLRRPTKYGVATVYSIPPQWMPGQQGRTIGEMKLLKQFDVEVSDDFAWTMLSELEKGFWPTISFQDWNSQFDRVSVGLNASDFYDTYVNFIQCVDGLLPFNFEDISFSVLSYKKNSSELTLHSRRQLEMIGAYIQADPSVDSVMLDGYSDSYGPRSSNQRLSEKRANMIQQYLVDLGVEKEKIQVTGHGEKRHIAPNDSSNMRARNRRVVIRMEKSYVNT